MARSHRATIFSKQEIPGGLGFIASAGPMKSSGYIAYLTGPIGPFDRQYPEAVIEPDPLRQFTRISNGIRAGELASGRTPDGKISLAVPMLAYLLLPKTPEFLRERMTHALLGSEVGAEFKTYIEFEGSLESIIKSTLGKWVVELIEGGGSRSLRELLRLLEAIESKSAWFTEEPKEVLTHEEAEFCKVLSRATCEIADVPTQKRVREEWLAIRSGRTERQFIDVRNALGFKWLPQAKRGAGRV